MDMFSPDNLVKHYDRLRAERANYDRTWQDVADYMRPTRAEFNSIPAAGQRRDQRIFNSEPLRAIANFAGGMYGMMTNPANRWFALRLDDEELNDFGPVSDWLYEVETRLMNSFGPEASRFYSVVPSLYADLACFGNGVFYSEEDPKLGRINDSVRPLSECVFCENAAGSVDTLYRKFKLTGRQTLQAFGADKLHQAMRRRVEKEDGGEFWFIHCVYPNEDPGRDKELTPQGRPFLSRYVDIENKHVVKEGGYFEFPYQVPRWEVASGEQYGRGLGEQNLSDVKMLNRMSETNIRAAQKIADPPLAAPDEGVIKQARTWAGGITYGAIDMNGVQLLKPLYTGGNVNISLEMLRSLEERIREGFFFSLMQMYQKGDMTATEWTGRQEEKFRLMGPNLGRVQHEFLSPLIGRRFGILSRAQALPPPPMEIQGREMRVEYVSPLARAQMASESNAIIRTYQGVAPIAQFDPSVLDNFDHDESAKRIGKGFGTPGPIIRGGDEVREIRAERAQQQRVAQGLGAAQAGAGALKQLADAGKSAAQAREVSASSGGQNDVGAAIEMLRSALRGRRAA